MDVISKIKSSTKVAIHFNPDLDACLAYWAACQIQEHRMELKFVSTSYSGELESDTVYLDIACGYKEIDGMPIGTALARQFPEMEIIAREVEMVDTGSHFDDFEILKSLDHQDVINRQTRRPRLAFVLNCLKEAYLDRQDRPDDKTVVEQMGKIFDGAFRLGRKRLLAKVLAENAEMVGKVAIIRQKKSTSLVYGVAEHLPDDTKAIVTQIGNNLGVKRLDGSLDLTKLNLPDRWYQHKDGFMAQWGDLSGKGSPAAIVPTISANQLAEMVDAM